jgi:hypothetical protein
VVRPADDARRVPGPGELVRGHEDARLFHPGRVRTAFGARRSLEIAPGAEVTSWAVVVSYIVSVRLSPPPSLAPPASHAERPVPEQVR